jgi:hypothetical protein
MNDFTPDPDLMVTLMFRKPSFKNRTDLGTEYRSTLIRGIFFNLTHELGLSLNNVIYCGAQKTNNNREVYVQLLVYCMYPTKVSVEETQRKLTEILGRHHEDIIIPKEMNENLEYEHIKRLDRPKDAFSFVFNGKRNNDVDMPLIKTNHFEKKLRTKANWLEKQSLGVKVPA